MAVLRHEASESERTRAEVEGDRLGLMRAVGLGIPVFLAFLPVDLYVRAELYPETALAWCLAWRLGGAALLFASWLLVRRPGWSGPALMRLAGGIIGLSVVTLAGLAIGLGGIASDYVFQPAFYAVGLATFLPGPWHRNARLVGPATLAFFATLVIGVALTPRLAPQLGDRRAWATFVQSSVVILGVVGFGIASGHVLWRARRDALDARRLGRYLLRSRLGEGGMNEVWLAWDTQLRREVALKILHASGIRGAAAEARRTRFEREARATIALHSPHTIRIYDYGADAHGSAWIAMERLRGRDLDRVLGECGPLDPRRAVAFARQAAASLAEAHARGIVHRDIKPANLFACAPSEPSADGPAVPADFVKVLDFGIARQLDSQDAPLTQAGVVVGTPAFMPPEVLRGGPADARSDVWSLGATLHVLIFGRLASERSTGGGPRPEVPTELQALLRDCLAPDPAERPADGAALVARLERLPLGPWTEVEAEAAWRPEPIDAQAALAATEADPVTA